MRDQTEGVKARVRPLKRLSGHSCTAYATADGRFEIVKDPSQWAKLETLDGSRTPRAAWLAYAMNSSDGRTDLPVFVRGSRAWPTLREACEALAEGPIEVEGV